MSYKPLFIDPEAERFQLSRIQTFSRWLHKYIPLRIYYELPYGRRSLESQLKSRSSAPVNEWDTISIPYRMAKPILDVISVELNLPNAHFIPEDPVEIALIEDYDDFPLLWLYAGFKELMKLSVEFDEFRHFLVNEATNIESLVRYLIRLDNR
ncbi:hypothetical protein GC170_04065 [bacterium]|nr:hypothetical protein [bacterium]